MKICRKCGIEKANKYFGVNNRYFDNLQRICKECYSIERKNSYSAEEARRKWKRNKYSTPEFAEDRRLKSAYGISKELRDFISRRQNDACAICGRIIKLVVDHDHTSGIVRGLLCSKCNLGLGSFNDNIDMLRDAYQYLLDFNDKQNTDFN